MQQNQLVCASFINFNYLQSWMFGTICEVLYFQDQQIFFLGKTESHFFKNFLHFRSFLHKNPREQKKEINEPELDENLHMQTENNNRMVCGKKFQSRRASKQANGCFSKLFEGLLGFLVLHHLHSFLSLTHLESGDPLRATVVKF